jgi:hypothetical protein
MPACIAFMHAMRVDLHSYSCRLFYYVLASFNDDKNTKRIRYDDLTVIVATVS